MNRFLCLALVFAAAQVLAACGTVELADLRIDDVDEDVADDSGAGDAAEPDGATDAPVGDAPDDEAPPDVPSDAETTDDPQAETTDDPLDDESDLDTDLDDTDAADTADDVPVDETDTCVDNGCGGCTPLPALGAPCGPCGADENVCDGNDAVRCDGATACVEDPPSAPGSVSATDGDFEDFVRVTWGSVPRATAYRVYRDGAFVVETSERSYDDVEAPDPPPPPAVTDLSATDGADGVGLAWTPVLASDGAAAAYTVRAWAPDGGESVESAANAGNRGASPIVGYDVRVGTGAWSPLADSSASTRRATAGDGVAPRPVVTAGSATATRATGGIELRADGFGVETEAASYRVRARTATQTAEPSNAATGTWQGGALVYAWRRAASAGGPFGSPVLDGATVVDSSALGSATRYHYELTVSAGAATPLVVSPPVSAVAPHCGDAQLDAGEACDGAVPAGVTCASLGFTSGTPSCAAGCTVNTSACTRLPEVTTSAVASGTITATSAALGGNVTSLGVPNPTQHGFCRGTSANPEVGGSGVVCSRLGARSATGTFSETVSGLSASTTYHVRAYATSTAGTAYGTSRSFTTLSDEPVTPALGGLCSSNTQCSSGLCSTDAAASTNRRCVPRELSGAAGGAMEFRYVPATGSGGFTMGSPSGELGYRGSDEAQHIVQISRATFVGRTEVTQGQWKAATGGTNPSCFQSTSGTLCTTSNANDSGPVEGVDWWSAAAYANWMSELAGLARCYTFTPTDWDRTWSNWSDGNGENGTMATNVSFVGVSCTGYRLLTEAEWEWSARGGTTTTTYGGNLQSPYDCESQPTLNGIAWYCGNSGRRTQTVGGKMPNAYGLYDMLGNVREWVTDWYVDPHPSGTDPVSPSGSDVRVNRGGGWNFTAGGCRAAMRWASGRGNDLGFRLSRSLP